MKVVIISHTYISPINRDKWKVLSKLYPHTQLLVIFPKLWPSALFSHKAHVDPHEQSPGCRFVALDCFKAGNELLYRYSFSQLYTTIKKFQPDLIHVEQGDSALSYFQANMCCRYLNKNIKSVFFTWINWKPKHSRKYKLLWSPIEKINRQCASGAIAGNRQAQEILKEKGFSRPIMVLPQLGVNTQIFHPAKKIDQPGIQKKNTSAFLAALPMKRESFSL